MQHKTLQAPRRLWRAVLCWLRNRQKVSVVWCGFVEWGLAFYREAGRDIHNATGPFWGWGSG